MVPLGVVRAVRQARTLGPQQANIRSREASLEPLLPSATERVLGVFRVVPGVVVVRLRLGAASGLQQVGQQPVDGLCLVVHACLVTVPPRPGVPALRVRQRVCFVSPLDLAFPFFARAFRCCRLRFFGVRFGMQGLCLFSGPESVEFADQLANRSYGL